MTPTVQNAIFRCVRIEDESRHLATHRNLSLERLNHGPIFIATISKSYMPTESIEQKSIRLTEWNPVRDSTPRIKHRSFLPNREACLCRKKVAWRGKGRKRDGRATYASVTDRTQCRYSSDTLRSAAHRQCCQY